MTNLKALRISKKVSQQAVADYLGITRQAYGNYETGKRQADYETLLKLGEFFGVTINALLQKETPQPEGRGVTDDDIKFALFGDNPEITDEMYEDVKRFARFIAEKKKE